MAESEFIAQPYIPHCSTLTLTLSRPPCPTPLPLPNGTTLPCQVIGSPYPVTSSLVIISQLKILDPQPPRDHLADNQTPGNATRDRLAAIVSGNEQAPL